ncbi:glycosyltransferase family 2 protein [Myxococcota bacterium]|nr:glycosyltransferase family 2 protein [Myxococcota bacterium]
MCAPALPPALGLVLPLYDEATNVERTVRGLHAALGAVGAPFLLLMVDNGSTDDTPRLVDALAAELGHEALHLSPNAGYGGGVLQGLRALRTPALGWSWGDGQIDPEVVAQVWSQLGRPGVQLAKARRVRREDGPTRAVVSGAYNLVTRRAFGLGTTDTNGCPKLMTRGLYERLELASTDWFLDPELMLKAQALGVQAAEVDAVMRPRVGGASKVRAQTLWEFTRHLWAWRRGWRPGAPGAEDPR